MARIGKSNWLMQQAGGTVVIFHEYTEDEIVQFDPRNANDVAKTQKVIHDSNKLTDEEKTFAHFWSGYFYAHATMTMVDHLGD